MSEGIVMTDQPDHQMNETVLLDWPAQIKLLTNAQVWKGILLCFGIGALGVSLLFSFISKSVMGFVIGAAIFAGLMVVYVLIAVVIDLKGTFLDKPINLYCTDDHFEKVRALLKKMSGLISLIRLINQCT